MNGWNKKIDLFSVLDLLNDEFEGWDKIDGKTITVRVFYKFQSGYDQQHDMNVWADDNNVGLFYSETCYTEGGTPIVRTEDKIGVSFTFQKETDALAFKLRWV